MNQATTTVGRAIDAYDVKVIRGLAPGSQKARKSQLGRWSGWLFNETHPHVYVADVDDMLMARYFNTIRPPYYEAATFNHYRSIHKGFWKFCINEGWTVRDPTFYIKLLHVPEKARLRLSAEEMLEMLDDAPNARDRYALAVGMHTFLRSQDIAALKIHAVNLYDRTLTAYISKTKRVMTFTIADELVDETMRWFEAYAQLASLASWTELGNDWTLVPSLQAIQLPGHAGHRAGVKPYSQYKNLHEVVQNALVARGLPIRDPATSKSLHEGFHTLRRSSLREIHDLAAEEGDPDPMGVAQAAAGHKSRSSTEIYLGMTPETRRRDALMKGTSYLTRKAELDRTARSQTVDATPLRKVRHA